MAKFNKDRFINDITGKVQSAIDRHLITDEDINNNDMDRIHGFIQYELTELIEDRKFALDVLSDFNYDEKTKWSVLEEKFGKFKTLMDIALVNLWKFLENEGATEYSYYHKADTDEDATMLDKARDEESSSEGDDYDDDDFDTHNRHHFDDDEDEFGGDEKRGDRFERRHGRFEK